MDKTSEGKRKADLLATALDHYEEDRAHWSPIYEQMQKDHDFMNNTDNCQWNDGREYEGSKLQLVINKCESECDAIINEIRSSGLSIDTTPVDDDADVDTSEIIDDLIRRYEVNSSSDNAYDVATGFQVPCGLGWLRVNLDWIDGSFDQEPRIMEVSDFTSILIDKSSKKIDGSDMNRAFVVTSLPSAEFKQKYKKAKEVDFDKIGENWQIEGTVVIAEYFYRDCEYETLYQVSRNGELDTMLESERAKYEEKAGYEFDEIEGEFTDPMDGVIRIVRKRKQKVDKVKWCKLNGQEVLEETEWLGSYIPIVPVYGKMSYIKGKRKVSGLIKNLRDPQKLLNYNESFNTETVALSPKANWVGYDEVVHPYLEDYKDSNRKNYPILQAKVVFKNGVLLPPPQRQMPPTISPAMQQQTMLAMQHMKSVTGKVYDEGERQLGAESGEAIKRKEDRSSVASYHYMDNMGKSLQQLGRIIVDLIPKIVTSERVERLVGRDGEQYTAPVNQPYAVENGQKVPYDRNKHQKAAGIYRLDMGKYDVNVKVGKSYGSQREEFTDKMIDLSTKLPEVMSPVIDLVVSHMDFPGAQDVAQRLKKMLPPELKDDEQTPEQLALIKAGQQIEMFKGQLVQLEQQLDDKKRSEAMDYEIKKEKNEIDRYRAEIDAFEARVKAAEAQGVTPQELMEFAGVMVNMKDQLDDATTAISLLLDADEGEQQPPVQ